MATQSTSTPAPGAPTVLTFPTKRKRAYASPQIGQCATVPQNVVVLPSRQRASAGDAEAVMSWSASEILVRTIFHTALKAKQRRAVRESLVRCHLASGGAKVFDDALKVIDL